jgi:hypothetical protein
MIEGWYVVTHGGIVPGQERRARPLFTQAVDMWQKQGTKFRPFATMFLTPGSGPRDHMAFMSMYRGRLNELHAFITSPEYEEFWAAAAQVLKNLSGRLYGGGTPEEIQDIMSGAARVWRDKGFIES